MHSKDSNDNSGSEPSRVEVVMESERTSSKGLEPTSTVTTVKSDAPVTGQTVTGSET